MRKVIIPFVEPNSEPISIIGSGLCGKSAATLIAATSERDFNIIGLEGITTTTEKPIRMINEKELAISNPYKDIEFNAEDVSKAKEMRRESSMYWKVWNHIQKNNRTVQEEYDLIIAKKSEMPRAQRDYLKAMYEYEPTEQDLADLAARDARIKEYESSQEEE